MKIWFGVLSLARKNSAYLDHITAQNFYQAWKLPLFPTAFSN
jgi:hypothetical protein